LDFPSIELARVTGFVERVDGTSAAVMGQVALLCTTARPAFSVLLYDRPVAVSRPWSPRGGSSDDNREQPKP